MHKDLSKLREATDPKQFRYFLLHEQKHFLAQRAGDLLTALQNLEDDNAHLGNRALIRAAQGVANQARRILHGRWDDADKKYLSRLQKVGVALLKAIDDKEDLETVIAACGAEVQKLITQLETPINALGLTPGG